ncbi:hypothetical protein BDQ12DRAFT_726525 [Crucibulum laeve]|uniref:Uncharacterized protein n=1 Tax=Crucibulum laeve TaxID=68775 RepID=A0A5C3LP84_9AGAR|nr:hypothetical protein BDQ12DRAFT_726525 [Crucibulum laeve]
MRIPYTSPSLSTFRARILPPNTIQDFTATDIYDSPTPEPPETSDDTLYDQDSTMGAAFPSKEPTVGGDYTMAEINQFTELPSFKIETGDIVGPRKLFRHTNGFMYCSPLSTHIAKLVQKRQIEGPPNHPILVDPFWFRLFAVQVFVELLYADLEPNNERRYLFLGYFYLRRPQKTLRKEKWSEISEHVKNYIVKDYHAKTTKPEYNPDTASTGRQYPLKSVQRWFDDGLACPLIILQNVCRPTAKLNFVTFLSLLLSAPFPIRIRAVREPKENSWPVPLIYEDDKEETDSDSFEELLEQVNDIWS